MKNNMKISFGLLFGVIAGLGVSSASAETEMSKADEQNRFCRMREEVIKKFDKDGDGKLNEQERAAAKEAWQARCREGKGASSEKIPEQLREKIRARLGSDGSAGKNAGACRNMRGEGGERFPIFQMLLKRFDKNKDGRLDEEEKAEARKVFEEKLAEFRAPLMERFDKNGDGKLDEQERAAAKEAWRERRQEGGGENKRFGSEQGFGPFREKLLEKFDRNGDGKLDENERAAAKEARQALRKGK